tara:strand:+ start:184 stop:498 length:315 start_codon:yes stop_codon:yes gene_type:complete
MFCPKCKSMLVLNRSTGQRECKRPNCGHSENKGKTKITSREMEKKEIVVTEGLEGTLPTAKILCEKCGHNEASWVIRQTRAADEPSTRIYQCTNPKCKHKWREY